MRSGMKNELIRDGTGCKAHDLLPDQSRENALLYLSNRLPARIVRSRCIPERRALSESN
jgi:hypothetical protein